jgi:hypothetical protein
MAVGCFLIPVITLILVLRFVSQRGIRSPQRIPRGTALSIPPAGYARILARKVADKLERVEWQWTLVGDRNWTEARSNDDGFVLGGPYPFNSRSTLGGTHVWTVSLAVWRRTRATDQIQIDSSLHGSNAVTVSQTRTLAATTISSMVSVTQSGDSLVRVGSKVKLADIGGKTLSLELQP